MCVLFIENLFVADAFIASNTIEKARVVSNNFRLSGPSLQILISPNEESITEHPTRKQDSGI
jgi:hypothetical protein